MLSREQLESYQQGYRNGRLDRLNGVCLEVSLRSRWGLYATGYYDGWHQQPKHFAG